MDYALSTLNLKTLVVFFTVLKTKMHSQSSKQINTFFLSKTKI